MGIEAGAGEPCQFCGKPRKDIPFDDLASDFAPQGADIEDDEDGFCIAVGTPCGYVFLLVEFCPKCGRELKG